MRENRVSNALRSGEKGNTREFTRLFDFSTSSITRWPSSAVVGRWQTYKKPEDETRRSHGQESRFHRTGMGVSAEGRCRSRLARIGERPQLLRHVQGGRRAR